MTSDGEPVWLWIFVGFVILFHSFGFWLVCRWVARRNTALSATLGGAIAGSTGWFWFNFVGFVLNWYTNTPQGYLPAFWLLSLWFVPFIGVLYTLFFWLLFNRFKLRIPVLGRVLVGLAVGLITGSVVGLGFEFSSWLEYGDRYIRGHPGVVLWNYIITPIACASAIMAGQPNSMSRNTGVEVNHD